MAGPGVGARAVSHRAGATWAPERHRPAAADDAAAPPAPFPIVDLGRLSSPSPDDDGGGGDEAAKLRRALDSWGLFQVTNHGIEASLMDELMSASKEFFRQPLQVKREFSNLNDGEQFRAEGYGNDKVRSKDQILDWSDRIYLKVEPEDERNLALWPKHPSSFRDALHEFTVRCRRVKRDVLRTMARIAGLECWTTTNTSSISSAAGRPCMPDSTTTHRAQGPIS
uniref:Non-haem dioxygenase N-terminal domain-containing protein n=1 Tax=Oryza meridionalis TaxID=40149 RepID=A0A0E0CJT3_9ORYZ